MLNELIRQKKVINKVKVKSYGYYRYLKKVPDVGCLSVAGSSRLFDPCLSPRMDTSDIAIDFSERYLPFCTSRLPLSYILSSTLWHSYFSGWA